MAKPSADPQLIARIEAQVPKGKAVLDEARKAGQANQARQAGKAGRAGKQASKCGQAGEVGGQVGVGPASKARAGGRARQDTRDRRAGAGWQDSLSDVADVAIIGAGPTGASAAKEAVERGLSALLFDPAHPRRKACGGGLTVKDLATFDAPDEAIDRPMDQIKFIKGDTVLDIAGKPGHLGKLIRRDAWDHYLYLRALEAGAIPILEKVVSLERLDVGAGDGLGDEGQSSGKANRLVNGSKTSPAKDSGATISDQAGTGGRVNDNGESGANWVINGNYEARFLICADGVNGFCRRKLSKPIPPEHLWLAFGYYIEATPPDGSIEFILGELAPETGYLWVFPKADHFNVGICYPMKLGRELLERTLMELIEKRGWAELPRTRFGALIPSATDPTFFDAPVSGDDWVLAGDAAGHVDPIHGEGLYYAVNGGRLAARAVAEGDPTRFEQYWRDDYARDMYRHCELKQNWLFKPWFQKLGFGLGNTRTIHDLLQGMCDGTFHGSAMRAFFRRGPLALVQMLFRVRPRN